MHFGVDVPLVYSHVTSSAYAFLCLASPEHEPFIDARIFLSILYSALSGLSLHLHILSGAIFVH